MWRSNIVRWRVPKSQKRNFFGRQLDIWKNVTSYQPWSTLPLWWPSDNYGRATQHAPKKAESCIRNRKFKLGVVDKESGAKVAKRKAKHLAVVAVDIHSTQRFAQIDSSAILNFLSFAKCSSLYLDPMWKIMKVVDRSWLIIKGIFWSVPNVFEGMELKMDFKMMSSAPFDLDIVFPTLKRLGGVVYFVTEENYNDHYGCKAILSMVSNYHYFQ